MIDIDGFKSINDAHGHDAGDHVLKTIARRLTDGVREVDTVARLGGDEFVVILEEINERVDAIQVAEKLIASVREPIPYSSGELRATISVGIACFPDDGNEHDTLLKKADDAMYRAKSAGRNRLDSQAVGGSRN
jgi:diguanylate cyclase (GGDEF)-like protein